MRIQMDTFIFLGYEFFSSLIPFLIILLLYRNVQKKNGISFNWHSIIALITLAVYIVAVFHFTGAGTLYDGLIYKLELRQDQINLIPFSNIIDIVAYFLNVLLFIPFGLAVPIIWTKMRTLTNISGTAFFFTLLIESSQLLNHRRTDIDDIILNIVGAVIGFLLFKILDRITPAKYKAFHSIGIELPFCIIVIFVGRFFLYNEMRLAKLLYGF